MNTELLEKIAAHIEAHPQWFDMDSWGYVCGTECCIAGFASRLSSGDFETNILSREESIESEAVRLLDLTPDQAERLFFIEKWPEAFVFNEDGAPIPPSGAQGAARIRHFIATEGAE